MKQELDDALVRDFPTLYRERHLSTTVSCLAFGFACGDGWEPLLRTLSEFLEPYAVKFGIAAGQVKQKFGGLRYYLDYEDKKSIPDADNEAIESAIREAEAVAWKTCEVCGVPGKTGAPRPHRGWVSVECEACFEAGRGAPVVLM